jgi:hypothetical protein
MKKDPTFEHKVADLKIVQYFTVPYLIKRVQVTPIYSIQEWAKKFNWKPCPAYKDDPEKDLYFPREGQFKDLPTQPTALAIPHDIYILNFPGGSKGEKTEKWKILQTALQEEKLYPAGIEFLLGFSAEQRKIRKGAPRYVVFKNSNPHDPKFYCYANEYGIANISARSFIWNNPRVRISADIRLLFKK